MEFEDLVTARGTALLRFAVMLTGDPHQAEDLVVNAFMRPLHAGCAHQGDLPR